MQAGPDVAMTGHGALGLQQTANQWGPYYTSHFQPLLLLGPPKSLEQVQESKSQSLWNVRARIRYFGGVSHCCFLIDRMPGDIVRKHLTQMCMASGGGVKWEGVRGTERGVLRDIQPLTCSKVLFY